MGFFDAFNLFSPVLQTPTTTAPALAQVTSDRQQLDRNIEEILADSTFYLVNEYRESIGLRAVVREPRIDHLCKQHGLYMQASGCISHDNFQTFRGHAVRELGFTNSLPTENVAGGECYWEQLSENKAFFVANKLLEGWLASTQGHAENIRMQSHVVSGMGCIIRPTRGGALDFECFVTQIFGS